MLSALCFTLGCVTALHSQLSYNDACFLRSYCLNIGLHPRFLVHSPSLSCRISAPLSSKYCANILQALFINTLIQSVINYSQIQFPPAELEWFLMSPFSRTGFSQMWDTCSTSGAPAHPTREGQLSSVAQKDAMCCVEPCSWDSSLEQGCLLRLLCRFKMTPLLFISHQE